MKKLALILIFVLLCSCGMAEGMDFASLSDEQLQAVINGARNELQKRILIAGENTVLFEKDGVTVYLTGKSEVWGVDSKYLDLEAVVINDSDKTVSASMDSAYINGWEVYAAGIPETKPGKKQKGILQFSISEADVSNVEEIEEIEMYFYLYDSEEWETISTLDPIVIAF